MIDIVIYALVGKLLAYAAYTDYRYGVIKEWVSVSVFVLGMVLNFFLPGLFGFLVAYFAALLLFHADAWGGGDGNLFGALGAVTALSGLWKYATFLALIAATVLFYKYCKGREKARIGPAFFIAYLLYMVLVFQ